MEIRSQKEDQMAATEPTATVCVTVDFDAICIWMSWGARGSRVLSRGEFGAEVGAPRLLDLFERLSIPTTWFIPGHSADTYPDVAARVAGAGHEIAHHGYLHEAFDSLSPDEVRDVIRRGTGALERSTGQRPRGMRVPAGDFDGSLFELLVEEGFIYDSSVIGEYQPSWCRSKDELFDDRPPVRGQQLDLVELPLSFVMNDFSYFEFNYANPTLVGLSSPEHVFSIWRGQFDYMHERVPNGVLNLTLHPQSIGWGIRVAMLERFLSYCLETPGTEFATCETVAGRFRESEAARAGTGVPREERST
jgi:peptidoglycan/xylan/chitin deacetylase (PgdA/CDA1 family)